MTNAIMMLIRWQQEMPDRRRWCIETVRECKAIAIRIGDIGEGEQGVKCLDRLVLLAEIVQARPEIDLLNHAVIKMIREFK